MKKKAPDHIDGLLVLRKEAGMTSHTATAKVSRLFMGAKAGHTGTLDPMATGVLPILLGRSVKAAEYMIEGDKHYIAEMTLGLVTDTEDSTGQVLSHSDDIPAPDAVRCAIMASVGRQTQVPPMYSAIKVGGKKLVDLAREGKTVERTPREVTVYDIAAEPLSDTVWRLDVHCSKGTYIRTLCADIGKRLGCGAVMSALCRAEAGGFTLEDAVTLAELEKTDEAGRLALLKRPEDTFMAAWPAYRPTDFYARLLYHGCAVALRKLSGAPAFSEGGRVRLYDAKGFFGVASFVTDEEGAPALHIEKILRIDPPESKPTAPETDRPAPASETAGTDD